MFKDYYGIRYHEYNLPPSPPPAPSFSCIFFTLANQMGQQPPATPSSHPAPPVSSNTNQGYGAAVPSRSRADVDLLSMLGLQKGAADSAAAGQQGGGYGGVAGRGGAGGGGGAAHQQFAFHEPQPGARRTRAVNGGGSMALDPRARARALAGVAVGGAAAGGLGGRKLAGRPGGGVGSPGPMTADEMDRIVTGN